MNSELTFEKFVSTQCVSLPLSGPYWRIIMLLQCELQCELLYVLQCELQCVLQCVLQRVLQCVLQIVLQCDLQCELQCVLQRVLQCMLQCVLQSVQPTRLPLIGLLVPNIGRQTFLKVNSLLNLLDTKIIELTLRSFQSTCY